MKKVVPQTVVYRLPDASTLCDCFINQPAPYTFVNAADYGDDVLQTLCQLIPNFLLIEPDPACYEQSVDLLRRVRMWPKLPVKCVVLLPHGVSWLTAFDELDISGKVCLDNANEELVRCLGLVANGYRFLSARLQAPTTDTPSINAAALDELLTCRENEIVNLIALGYTNKEIAEQLFISVKTVETHKFNIVNKLKLSSTSELREWVRRKVQVYKEITLEKHQQNQ